MSVPLHILAVDDHVEVTAFLKDFLEQAGHQVDCAANGIEALNAVNALRRGNDRYHLVLADVHMPLLDGLSLIKELRRAKDYVDVAIITGNFAMMPHLEMDAQKLGCLMVLHKPLATDQLIQLVEFVGMRAARAPNPGVVNPAAGGGMTSRVARPDTPFSAPFSALDQAMSHRAPGPPGTDEYLPTQSSRGQVVPPASAELNARRTGQYYPAAPAAPQAAPAPFQQRRADDPRSTSRVAPPQAMPPGAAPYDPRQGQGLPPVPAPVAQPPYPQPYPQPYPPAAPRDPRLQSGVRDPRQQSASLPPIPSLPVDPRYQQQPAPYQPPQQGVDPRYAQPHPLQPDPRSAPVYQQPQDPRGLPPPLVYQPPPAHQQPPVYQAPPTYQQPQAPVQQPPAYQPPAYQPPPADPRRASRVSLPPVAQAPPQAPYDPRQAPPQAGFQARPVDPRRTSSMSLPAAPPVAGPPRARPIDPPPAMRTPLPAGGTGTDPYSPQTDPQYRQQTEANQSGRLRRTVGGANPTPQPLPPETIGNGERVRMVACAYCRGSFRAAAKPVPYNLVCVHCGQLNRIDP